MNLERRSERQSTPGQGLVDMPSQSNDQGLIMEEARLYLAVTGEQGVYPLFQLAGKPKAGAMGASSLSPQRKSVIQVFGT
jgi:hypothetical protein